MKIYITDVTVPPIEYFLPRVSRERIERMERYRFEIDKRRGLAAETLLNYGLQRACGRLSVPVKLFRDEDGKPHLAMSDADKALLRSEGVLFGENIEFSLSHSGNYAVCAISEGNEGEIGIDIEKHKKDQKGIAEHFFCEGEKQRIRSDEDFYKYWTLKESFIKAVGKGLAISLDSFEVFGSDHFPCADLPADRALRHELVRADPIRFSGSDHFPCAGLPADRAPQIIIYKHNVNRKEYRGRVYHPFEGYTLSVCAEGRDVKFPAQDEIETVVFPAGSI